MKTKKFTVFLLALALIISSVCFINLTVSSKKNNSSVYATTREENVAKAIARAEYMRDYRWSPVKTLTGWNTTLYAGSSYNIPYSQPIWGGYLFYNISLTDFEALAANSSSAVYTSYGWDAYGSYQSMPKYGTDCSAFAGFCIGYPSRLTTTTIGSYANSESNGFYYKSYSTVAAGDLLNDSGSHVMFVKAVSGDYITTIEQTPNSGLDCVERTRTKSTLSASYSVVGYDYSGSGAPYDDVTGQRTTGSINYSSTNTVLGDCGSYTASSNYDLSQVYDFTSSDFENRKASISSFSGEDYLYFQSDSVNQTVEATFSTTSKKSSEEYGKFGIAFFTKNKSKGFFFYADAEGSTGTSVSSITGTNFGIVQRDSSNSNFWLWQTSNNLSYSGLYDATSAVTIKIERLGRIFKIYVDGKIVDTIDGINYSISAEERIFPAILTFNVGIDITDYSETVTENSITTDGDISDWETLSNWNEIQANAKSVYDDSDTSKGAIFYTRLTQDGLLVYAKAIHDINITGKTNWWCNTNFEIFINGSENTNQFYAIHNLIKGFASCYFNTFEENGRYCSVLEGFITSSTLSSLGYETDNISIGFAFKVDDLSGTADEITVAGTATSYWCAENSDPRDIAHTVSPETFTTSYAGATFQITGKTLSSELYPKLGLLVSNFSNKGFFYFANAEATEGTEVSSITGTQFGYVLVNGSESYSWSSSYSQEYIDNADAVFSASEEFTISIFRNANNSFNLYVGDSLVATLNGENYGISSDELVTYEILNFNLSYTVSSPNASEDGTVGNITFDGDVTDWNDLNYTSLTTNDTIFNTYLTEDGLFVSVISDNQTTASIDYDSVILYLTVGTQNNMFLASRFGYDGFTNAIYTTSANGSVFEGFIAMNVLTNKGAFNGTTLNYGCSFTPDGSTTVDFGSNPLLVANTVTLTDETTTSPIIPPDSSNSSSSQTSSSSNLSVSESTSNPSNSESSIENTTQSSSNAQSSTNSISSESSIPASSTVSTTQSSSKVQSSTSNSSSIGSTSSIEVQSSSDTTTSEQSSENISSTDSTEVSDSSEETLEKKGCRGSIYSVIYMLPLAFIALVVIIKKVKN